MSPLHGVDPPRLCQIKGDINDLLSCNPNLPLEQLPSVCQGVPQNGRVQSCSLSGSILMQGFQEYGAGIFTRRRRDVIDRIR